MIEDIRNIKSGKKELRKFGIEMGVILIAALPVITWILFRKRVPAYLYEAGAIFIISGLAMPWILKPIQKIWLTIGIILGYLVSPVFMGALFYLVIAPIGIIMKLLGKDMLDLRISKEKPSYWLERPVAVKAKESYENQY